MKRLARRRWCGMRSSLRRADCQRRCAVYKARGIHNVVDSSFFYMRDMISCHRRAICVSLAIIHSSRCANQRFLGTNASGTATHALLLAVLGSGLSAATRAQFFPIAPLGAAIILMTDLAAASNCASVQVTL